MGKQKQTCSSP